MRHGFIKAAAVTPKIRVADCKHNAEEIKKALMDARAQKAKVVVFPELCLTGYTCEDLFLQESLLLGALEALKDILEYSKGMDMLYFIGLPLEYQGKLYNTMAACSRGEVLGVVPKINPPNYSVYYEARHFAAGMALPEQILLYGEPVPFGANLLFTCAEAPDLVVAAEICEDLWMPAPPSIYHAVAGATLIVNGSASDESIGKEAYRRDLVRGQSGRLVCGYIYASAGEGESSTDLVFSGHNLICENGALLKEAKRFATGAIYSEIDLGRIKSERRRMITHPAGGRDLYQFVPFHLLEMEETQLTRKFPRQPFVPSDTKEREERCEEILTIQAMGLKKRLEHTKAGSAVIGISGGLDSTLALLVTVRAFDMLGRDRKDIVAVTMPCFGTTDRTYGNAVALNRHLHTTLREIPIKEAVKVHFQDIGQEEGNHDVTYENSQARERTQILMDVANMTGGLVIGTGDLSELALGWATYNGDHMSMYGVNASIPKTLVRHLVSYYAESCGDEEIRRVLQDVLDTPVSPELLPPENGEISQKTEDLVGPYELHDFFLYYMMRFGYRPEKLYRIAVETFEGAYGGEIILKWMKVFYRRFFAQQFKRSCLPDGPRVGSVSLSPRGDLRMPSDACANLWLEELEGLKA